MRCKRTRYAGRSTGDPYHPSSCPLPRAATPSTVCDALTADRNRRRCRRGCWFYRDTNQKYLDAWKNAQTGYPWIDAAMTQLRKEGWIHHLARHAVACFLTRGDLYLSWEEVRKRDFGPLSILKTIMLPRLARDKCRESTQKRSVVLQGAKVFDVWLLDADWALNNCNWMWLSASAFFHTFFRVYSPVSFGQKTDKEGAYVRHYLPVLAKMPKKCVRRPQCSCVNSIPHCD
jgi:cryptochrome